ncbi:three component ABC system middle component [Candidatus Palauibacter sp.]|uniref:three component ABC system middle component n=1 Tax=Candidatus Palauibacter sp. TaxID=3101350 RepID=UPI003B58C120
MTLSPWSNRWPREEANHFNPAYCGVLVYEFVRAYENARKDPAPFALLFCALPIALHRATRDRLPASIITQLLPWLERNRDVRVGFAQRARNLAPYILEALRYASARRAIRFAETGVVTVGPKRASFTQSALDDTTADIRDTVHAVRKVGRWFAASGDPATILAAWGVRI